MRYNYLFMELAVELGRIEVARRLLDVYGFDLEKTITRFARLVASRQFH